MQTLKSLDQLVESLQADSEAACLLDCEPNGHECESNRSHAQTMKEVVDAAHRATTIAEAIEVARDLGFYNIQGYRMIPLEIIQAAVAAAASEDLETGDEPAL
jgi:hypothetical protein